MKEFETKLSDMINVLLESPNKKANDDSESNLFSRSWRIIPEKYVKQGKAIEGHSLALNGFHYEEFNSTLRYLRNLEETSHLKKKELNNLLWDFVFRVHFEIYYEKNNERFKLSEEKEKKKKEEIIDDFKEDISRPSFEWIVLVELPNIELSYDLVISKECQLYNFDFSKKHTQQIVKIVNELKLSDNTITWVRKEWQKFQRRVLYRPLLELKIIANNGIVCNLRKKELLKRIMPSLHSVNAIYNLSGHNKIVMADKYWNFVIPLNDNFIPTQSLIQSSRNYHHISLKQKELENYSHLFDLILTQKSPNEFDLSFIRSIKWYNDGLIDNRLDVKLLFYMISLDTLFLPEERRPRKLLTFRIMLVQSRLEGHFNYPHETWIDYDVRSFIVHGEYRLDEFTKEYRTELSEKQPYEKEINSLEWKLRRLFTSLGNKITELRKNGIEINSKEQFIEWIETKDEIFYKSVNWVLNVSSISKESDLWKHISGNYGKELKEWKKNNTGIID